MDNLAFHGYCRIPIHIETGRKSGNIRMVEKYIDPTRSGLASGAAGSFVQYPSTVPMSYILHDIMPPKALKIKSLHLSQKISIKTQKFSELMQCAHWTFRPYLCANRKFLKNSKLYPHKCEQMQRHKLVWYPLGPFLGGTRLRL